MSRRTPRAPRRMIALVHSPLVGPSTWWGVADELRARDPNRLVVVPDLRPAIAAGPPFFERLASVVVDACAAAAATAVGEGPVMSLQLVGHSRGGPLLPSIAAALGVGVDALMFVDSALPRPGRSWFDDAPAVLAAQRREMAVDGLLPPWHEWFGPDAIAGLVPDATLLASFEAEIPRLPIAYFEEALPEAGWRGPCGYLQLSEAYEDDAAEARSLGWLVVNLPTDHLAPVTRPADVAAAIEDAIARLIDPS